MKNRGRADRRGESPLRKPERKNRMKTGITALIERERRALDKIGRLNLLKLPRGTKETLKQTGDLEVKVKMLEAIAEQGNI